MNDEEKLEQVRQAVLKSNTPTEWEEVQGADAHNFKDEPELVGVLVDIEKSKFGGSNYVIQRASDGKSVLVFGKTVIETKLSRVDPGKTVRITSLGEVKSKKTGRAYQDFKVEVSK